MEDGEVDDILNMNPAFKNYKGVFDDLLLSSKIETKDPLVSIIIS